MPHYEWCQDSGAGVHETRPEYRIKYKNTFLLQNQLNQKWAVVVTNDNLINGLITNLASILGWLL